jgi:hypothetical protein
MPYRRRQAEFFFKLSRKAVKAAKKSVKNINKKFAFKVICKDFLLAKLRYIPLFQYNFKFGYMKQEKCLFLANKQQESVCYGFVY